MGVSSSGDRMLERCSPIRTFKGRFVLPIYNLWQEHSSIYSTRVVLQLMKCLIWYTFLPVASVNESDLSTNLQIWHFPQAYIPRNGGRSVSQLRGLGLVYSDLTSSSVRFLALLATMKGLGPTIEAIWGARVSTCQCLVKIVRTSSHCVPNVVMIFTWSERLLLASWSFFGISSSFRSIADARFLEFFKDLCG